MKERVLTIPQIILIAGTRVALGAGIGLLLAGQIDEGERRGAGCALLTFGVLTSIPLFIEVHGKTLSEDRRAEAA
jgi:hypothetical protein